MDALPVPLTLNHIVWGECVLERVDEADWLLRVNRKGALWRFPPSVQHEFEIQIEEFGEPAAETSTIRVAAQLESQSANG